MADDCLCFVGDLCGFVFVRQDAGEGGLKRLSDFASDFVNYGSALLGIVAASARREALYLAGCRGVRLHGVLGVGGHKIGPLLHHGSALFQICGVVVHVAYETAVGMG